MVSILFLHLFFVSLFYAFFPFYLSFIFELP